MSPNSATFDGNGNVIGYVDMATGVKNATYEYNAFGETIIADGVDLPFRFSTKYTDGETGLLYYGLRYYSPGTGRWVNRDPIEEQGGSNLSALLGNDPVNNIDRLGLELIAFTYATFIETATAEAPFGRLFAGDNKRVFSNAGHFRSYNLVVVDTDKKAIVHEVKEIGITFELDPKTGRVIRQGSASTSTLTAKIITFSGDSCYFQLWLKGHPSDPIIFGAPDVDYTAVVVFDLKKKKMIWSVNHDPFPAHQFAIDDDMVHTFSAVGHTPWSLFPLLGSPISDRGERDLKSDACCK